MTMKEARIHFTQLIRRASYAGESTLVTDHGKPAAMVVPVTMWEAFKAAARGQDALEAYVRERIASGETIEMDIDELKRQAGR